MFVRIKCLKLKFAWTNRGFVLLYPHAKVGAGVDAKWWIRFRILATVIIFTNTSKSDRLWNTSMHINCGNTMDFTMLGNYVYISIYLLRYLAHMVYCESSNMSGSSIVKQFADSQFRTLDALLQTRYLSLISFHSCGKLSNIIFDSFNTEVSNKTIRLMP